jgi:hypothetical protein
MLPLHQSYHLCIPIVSSYPHQSYWLKGRWDLWGAMTKCPWAVCLSICRTPVTHHLVPPINLASIQVGFEVPTTVSTKMAAFWVVALCSLVEVYQCFRGPSCLHLQGDE